jgi:predicted amidohydrolase
MVRIASAQTPDFRDDVPAALDHLVAVAAEAEAAGAALVAFPEGYLQGYLLADADVRRVALDLASCAFDAVLARFPRTGPTIVVGLIERADGRFFNTAIVVRRGTLIGRYRKMHLLAAERAFTPGTEVPVFTADGLRFAIAICYDTNFPAAARRAAAAGAVLLVCCANNMMAPGQAETYRDVHNRVRADRCRETGLWLVSSDVAGARDGKVSLGPSAVLAPTGAVVAELPLGRPGLLCYDLPV